MKNSKVSQNIALLFFLALTIDFFGCENKSDSSLPTISNPTTTDTDLNFFSQ